MKKVLTVLATVFVGFVIFSISASAATYTGYLSIPSGALLPKDNNVTWSTTGATFYTASAIPQSFFAPVFLPQGAVIKKVTLEAADASTDGFVKVQLCQYQYDTVAVFTEIQTSTPLANGNERVNSADLTYTVDNSEYSYGIIVVLDNGTAGAWQVIFYKLIIEYEYKPINATVVIPLG